MKALTWQARRRVEVTEVPDPRIEQPTDAIVRITSTAICGSDLHLYELMGPFLDRGDVLGHEAMGVVEEVGAGIRNLRVGQRVVVPFNISCGECFMCVRGLQSQCETTQVREYGSGAALFGYTKLYGQVPGGQAERLRVPLADYNTIPVGEELPDERYLFLSDILPTAWQGVQYAHVPDGGTLAVVGWAPSASSPRGSDVTSATTSSASTPYPSAAPWPSVTASAPSIRRVPSMRCSTRRRGEGRMPRSTPSAWKPTATPSSVPPITRSAPCPRPSRSRCCRRRGWIARPR